jgi:hypothetical protein
MMTKKTVDITIIENETDKRRILPLWLKIKAEIVKGIRFSGM